ncbi:MAG: ubiquitin-like protein Pup [Corynebacterium sp.]|nr:ubiquitin-like protein Pup [Corynebacterium sp.]
MPRISLNQTGGSGDENQEEAGLVQKNISTDDTDDLLAEIDGLLENNAEEFVRSYVQKGGE